MKGNTEDEIEEKLNNAKNLIFLLNSRDAFLKIYAKQLSSRLLNGTTVSNDAEKTMYNLMQVTKAIYSNTYENIRLSGVR